MAVLLTTIATASAITAYFWAMPRISLSMDMSESVSVQSALASCDSKILETARTGSGNKCLIPAARGILTAENDGLYYSLSSVGQLCDSTNDWVVIDANRHIELLCSVGATNASIFNLRWRYPKSMNVSMSDMGGSMSRYSEVVPIDFSGGSDFRTVSVFIYLIREAGITGQNIDINRRQLTADNVTLGVRIY